MTNIKIDQGDVVQVRKEDSAFFGMNGIVHAIDGDWVAVSMFISPMDAPEEFELIDLALVEHTFR